MRAVTIAEGRLVVAERPDPEPGSGELLVRVRAAGINGADLHQVGGRYPVPPGSPSDIPGLELAGEVAAVGPGVLRFGPGDRVMAVVGGGGQAELAVVHERAAMPVPGRLGWAAAGGLPEAVTTAHDALFTQAGLGLGERLLVHGAAGGVGTAAVQLGAAAGARVVASVRNPEHHQAVVELGAAVVTDPGKAFGHGPFDVILELVGAPNFPANLDALATGGRLLVIGVGAGASVEVDLRTLMARRARVLASLLRPRPLEEKADAARRVEHQALPLVADGRLRVPVAATFALERAQEAYDRFAAGGKLGKLVLVT
jgi:NADPH:quinone reductase-like Zn-dependent oxidoreductase